MKPRLWFSFSLLVVLPIAALCFLGVELAQDEATVLRTQYRNLFLEHLRTYKRGIEELVRTRESELDALLRGMPTEPETLHALTRENGYIEAIFVLDEQGRLVYPDLKVGAAGEEERRFLERTANIWSKRDIWFRLQGADGQTEFDSKAAGWYKYYWGNEIRTLYFRPAGALLFGVEFNRIRFLADVIGQLPDQLTSDTVVDGGVVVLQDDNRDVIYQWGPATLSPHLQPTVAVPLLNPPLYGWRLLYYAPPNVLERPISDSVLFSVVPGVAFLILTLVLLAVYFYREQNRELREASQRVNFVNQVSHELKTPLTNIRMYAELLEDELADTDDRAERYVGIIVSESQRLSRLIANILSFARHQREQLSVRKAPAVVDDVVRQTLDQFAPSLAAAGVSPQLDLSAGATVRVDADALGQMLGNLLSNVEKYAAGRPVDLMTRQAGGVTTLTVRDHGPGIPKAARAKVFEPFHRLSNALSDGVTGT
ncbi:MAG: HAMP domain-containing histidine kinase, partial [Bdellovibrionales bacterium]|nr:HAMP domain-containing histidine kinase [Bdellovibrionales bacterium]